jgi:DNA-binding transcriptional LysR family regulator
MDHSSLPINASLKHLRCFTAVAREGSFTLAARRVFLTQSALTATIQQFEHALQLRLFDRTTRRVTLTREGASFLPVAERLLQEFDTAMTDVRAVAERRQGQLSIAAAPSAVVLLLAPAVAQLNAQYPNVRITVSDGGSEFVQRRVLASESDFGLASKWSEDPGLEFRPLLHDRFGIVCRPDHPLARAKGRLRWRRLESQSYVGLAPDTGIYAMLQAVPAIPAVIRKPHFQVSSTTSLHAMIDAGLGLSVLPALAANLVPLDSLAFRELTEPAVEREICLITRRGRSLSPAAQSIIEMIGESLSMRSFPRGVRLAAGHSARV